MTDLTTLREVLDNELEMCIGFDDNGTVIALNTAAMSELGYESEGINVKEIFTTIFPKDISINEYVFSVDGEILKTVLYRKNNTCFNGKIRFHRFKLQEDSVVNMVSVLNIDDEESAKLKYQRAESNIKESIKNRDQFVANLTHELRTPVNGIKGHINNLLADEDSEERRRVMNIVLKCCSNMEKIINNMLDYSKIEAGKFEINEELFHLRECIEHTVNTNIVNANEKGIKLLCNIADDVPETAVGDELRITQILNNLLSNAIKFTAIGYVSVDVYRTKQQNGRIELTFIVVDTGIGVSIEEQEKMFKSFSQVDGSITKRFQGTGLGLYVTKQLVELMNGSISLESEKGKGSIFTFTIQLGCDNKIKEETTDIYQEQTQLLHEKAAQMLESMKIDKIYVYSSEENKEEIRHNIEKLMLCIEMDNWEKAENFSDNIKQLCEGGDHEIQSLVLRMQMAVRKSDYEKSLKALNRFKEAIGLE